MLFRFDRSVYVLNMIIQSKIILKNERQNVLPATQTAQFRYSNTLMSLKIMVIVVCSFS